MCTPELIQLLETVAVNDLLQFAVWVMANKATIVELHQFAILRCIGLP